MHTRRESLTDLLTRFDLKRREDWKYSDGALLSKGEFAPFAEGSPEQNLSGLPAGDGLSLVFRNGGFSEENSNLAALPVGLSWRPVTDEVEPQGTKDNFQLALNGAVRSQGLILEVADGCEVEKPLHLYYLANSRVENRSFASRTIINAGRGSRLTVVEHFSGSVVGQYLNVPLTEIHCDTDSQIRHLKIIREETGGLHLGNTVVNQEANSRYESREFALGGKIIRRELHLDLAGEGASCDLMALSMAAGEDRRDMRTRVQHSVPGCRTDELYKGIFDQRSRGVFDGKVLVQRNAQRTDAHQSNRNLLLGYEAISYSIPRLEIYADDVKCSHGSTTGQMDDDQLFFLRSRGFDPATARVMLAKAFAGEILDGLSETRLRQELDNLITQRLNRSLSGENS